MNEFLFLSFFQTQYLKYKISPNFLNFSHIIKSNYYFQIQNLWYGSTSSPHPVLQSLVVLSYLNIMILQKYGYGSQAAHTYFLFYCSKYCCDNLF
jgi:hypothetical protein